MLHFFVNCFLLSFLFVKLYFLHAVFENCTVICFYVILSCHQPDHYVDELSVELMIQKAKLKLSLRLHQNRLIMKLYTLKQPFMKQGVSETTFSYAYLFIFNHCTPSSFFLFWFHWLTMSKKINCCYNGYNYYNYISFIIV